MAIAQERYRIEEIEPSRRATPHTPSKSKFPLPLHRVPKSIHSDADAPWAASSFASIDMAAAGIRVPGPKMSDAPAAFRNA